MTRETVEMKAGRLVDEGRVRILSRDRYVVVAEVDGDHGTYRVHRSVDGFESCRCPAVARCAHLAAVENVTGSNYDEEPMDDATTDPARPFDDIDPETGEILREHIDGQSPETAEIASDAFEARDPVNDTLVTQSAPATPESVGDVADGGVEAALLPVAEAPISYRTLKMVAKTDFVPRALRGNPAACLAAVLTGREMGLDPMESLRSIDVIDGRPSPSAHLLSRMIRAAGHQVEILEASDRGALLRGTRKDTGETLEVGFTIEEAVRAGLVTLDEDGTPRARSQNGKVLPWERYPEDMCFARALVRLWRRLFSDVQRLEA